MKVMKIICFLTVLVVTAVPAHNALALPDSAFVDGDGKSWEGHKTYDEVYVEWAVYDIADNPWEVEFPSGNNYIYAYQIANLGNDSIESFYLLDAFGGPEIDWSARASGTQAVDDGLHEEDVMPVLPCEDEAVWNWSPTDGDGFIMANGYSAFLIFASPYAPVVGGFGVARSTDDDSDTAVPDKDIPEPASIALFGIASSWLFANRRKKRHIA